MDDDPISRQAAIEVCLKYNGIGWVWSQILDELKEMPSAERHGKWLHGQGFAGNYFDCLICDQYKKESMAKTNYCPNCGARMDEVE